MTVCRWASLFFSNMSLSPGSKWSMTQPKLYQQPKQSSLDCSEDSTDPQALLRFFRQEGRLVACDLDHRSLLDYQSLHDMINRKTMVLLASELAPGSLYQVSTIQLDTFNVKWVHLHSLYCKTQDLPLRTLSVSIPNDCVAADVSSTGVS